MAEKSVQKIPKPQLRGLLASNVKFHLPVALTLSAVATILFKVFFVVARKAKYTEFYKNCDAEKDFERMRKAGVFKSC
jgi:cytochrome c oxidase subunit 6c